MRLGSLLFLIVVLFVLAVEWDVIIDYVNKITKQVGLKSPAYLLTVLEKESGFARDLGYNLGNKEKNIQRCVDMCYYTPSINNVDGRILTKCYNWIKGEFTINLRKSWCEDQYQALEKIVEHLKLDINKVPFSPDFGIGYAQFQPPTWESYPELKNKNPWNLEDSIYAAAVKILKDGIHDNERLAVKKYNNNDEYIEKFIESRKEWDQIISDTIFVFNCPSNNFSCALAKLKTEFDDCTENDWSIKRKKECIKTRVAQFKETKLANLEKEKNKLVLRLAHLQTLNSTAAILGFPELKIFQDKEVTIEAKDLPFLQNVSTETIREFEEITYKEEKIEQPPTQIIYKEEKIAIEQKQYRNLEKSKVNLLSKSISTNTKVIPATTTQNISTTTIQTRLTSTQESENKPKIIYGGGERRSSLRKDPCDDYKNINYPNILISEIQFETATDTKDEFIELYNPTDQEIDLTCWSLEKYTAKQEPTSTPTLTKLIPQSKFTGKIKPYSFFLITSSSTKEKYQGDLSYSGEYPYLIAINNVIILKKPNGEISDLVGYGDNPEKIYQFEGYAFTTSSINFKNKSIQRKNLQNNTNLQDRNDNSSDFWLSKPSPKFLRIYLIETDIENFQTFATSTEEGAILTLSWQEPNFNVSSTNYAYGLLISTSSDFNTFKLEDFGSTSSLPSPKFDSSTTTFETIITKCSATLTLYYFGLYLKDLTDEENKTDLAISSTTLPEDLCNPETEEEIISTSTTSTVKILISEVRVIEGTSDGEYIELYNPNEFPIDLSGWKLIRFATENNSSTIASDRANAKFKNVIMQPFSYLLLSNTSTLIIDGEEIGVDLVYASSHDLAKNDRLVLLDNNNKIIDEFSWEETSDEKSYSRKKIDSTNEENYFYKFIDWGNGYDTNQNSDFILVSLSPENSSTIKIVPTTTFPLEIKFIKDEETGFLITIIISWISPALYDYNENNYSYKLLISTSTEINPPSESFAPLENFATFTLPTFRLLSIQNVDIINLNTTNLGLPENFEFSQIKVKLELYKNNIKINESIFQYFSLE